MHINKYRNRRRSRGVSNLAVIVGVVVTFLGVFGGWVFWSGAANKSGEAIGIGRISEEYAPAAGDIAEAAAVARNRANAVSKQGTTKVEPKRTRD